jgi:hypothetical protein
LKLRVASSIREGRNKIKEKKTIIRKILEKIVEKF